MVKIDLDKFDVVTKEEIIELLATKKSDTDKKLETLQKNIDSVTEEINKQYDVIADLQMSKKGYRGRVKELANTKKELSKIKQEE